jgi:hypothetical protein
LAEHRYRQLVIVDGKIVVRFITLPAGYRRRNAQ